MIPTGQTSERELGQVYSWGSGVGARYREQEVKSWSIKIPSTPLNSKFMYIVNSRAQTLETINLLNKQQHNIYFNSRKVLFH